MATFFRRPLAEIVLFTLALVACSSSTKEGGNDDPYGNLYANASATVDTADVMGVWSVTTEDPALGVSVDQRIELRPQQVKFSARCSHSSGVATAGVTVSATVTQTSVVLNEGDEDIVKFGDDLTCTAAIFAGDGPLEVRGGSLNFTGSILFDRKIRD